MLDEARISFAELHCTYSEYEAFFSNCDKALFEIIQDTQDHDLVHGDFEYIDRIYLSEDTLQKYYYLLTTPSGIEAVHPTDLDIMTLDDLQELYEILDPNSIAAKRVATEININEGFITDADYFKKLIENDKKHQESGYLNTLAQ